MSRKPLTDMQKRYLWLMGSFPDRIMVQGRGYRTERTRYAVNLEGELVIFGYSNPAMWLENRGLIRKMQAPNSYTLTEDGEHEFQEMLARGDGLTLNRQIREVEAK